MEKKSVFLFILISLFVLVGCNDKELVKKHVPDAENSVLTKDGRFFVTGGHNIYELKKSGDSWTADSMLDGKYNSLGIVESGDYIYAIAMKMSLNYPDKIDLSSIEGFVKLLAAAFYDQTLFRAKIRDDFGNKIENPEFKPFYRFEDFLIPNGMACDGNGNLYIADSTYLPYGKIVKINTKAETIEPELWLDHEDGISSPNGMAIYKGYLYFSEFCAKDIFNVEVKIRKVSLIDKKISDIYKRKGGLSLPFSLFDDLCVGEINGYETIAATDYNKGTILFLDIKKYQEDPYYEFDFQTFAGPSSVNLGRGNLFEKNEIVVTEKGILMVDPYSDYGNKVSKVTLN